MKSSIGLYYQLTVTDKKTGKVISKTPLRRSKSFVKQFLQICEAQMFPAANINDVRDTLNSLEIIQDDFLDLKLDGAVGTALGTLVGTGTTAPTNLDYVIETLVAHGVGAGQLSYGAMSKTTAGVVGANVDLIITRTFTNSSGNTINITEAGIYCNAKNAGALTKIFLIVRDTFTLVAVADGQVLTVSYTLRTTV